MRNILLVSVLLTLLSGCASKPSSGVPASSDAGTSTPRTKRPRLTPEQEIAWKKWTRELRPGLHYVVVARLTNGTWGVLDDYSRSGMSDSFRSLAEAGGDDYLLEEATNPRYAVVVDVDLLGPSGPVPVAWYRDNGKGAKKSTMPPDQEYADSLADYLTLVQSKAGSYPSVADN